MKLLVFSKSFASPTLTFIYNEVTELAKSAEVLVLTCKRENIELFPFERVEEIPFSQWPLLDKYLTKFQHKDFIWAFKNLKFKKALNTLISNFKPDVVHLHFGFEALYFLENYDVESIPIFISFHGYDASHKLRSDRYKKNILKWLSKPNVIPVFVSKFMRNHVEATLGTPLERAKILYYGTDLDYFKPQNQSNYPEQNFLQVSSFAEKKGHEFTILAFSKFLKNNPDSPAKLILTGEGPLLEPTKRLVHSLGITSRVEFKGFVNKETAKALMEKASVFVHHSVTSASVGDMEGIPNALMEAMAMELPVLSTYHSGIPELVEDGINGYLVEERDVENYALKMNEILSWKRLPQNREKVQKYFEKKLHTIKLLELYQSAIS